LSLEIVGVNVVPPDGLDVVVVVVLVSVVVVVGSDDVGVASVEVAEELVVGVVSVVVAELSDVDANVDVIVRGDTSPKAPATSKPATNSATSPTEPLMCHDDAFFFILRAMSQLPLLETATSLTRPPTHKDRGYAPVVGSSSE
jgi:hypothetical protein